MEIVIKVEHTIQSSRHGLHFQALFPMPYVLLWMDALWVAPLPT